MMEKFAYYSSLMERLTDLMTTDGVFDLQQIYAVMTKLCILLRASRGVTSFFQSPELEAQGQGEIFTCFDSGEPSHLAARERTKTPTGMIGVCDVYIADHEEPWTEEERARIYRIQRMMLSFMSRARLYAEVERLIYYNEDGFQNTRFFNHRVREMIETGTLQGKAAARFNIRRMSVINQQFGREIGDALLTGYIRRIEETVTDPSGFVCRLNGDNFILLCDIEKLPELLGIFRGIPVQYGNEEEDHAMISSMAGLFVIPEDYEPSSPGDIMDKITGAYESARNGGKEEIVFSSPELVEEKLRMLRIQQFFAKALEEKEFLAYYQPKIAVFHNRLTGAEALCRWMHDGRIIPPMEFIPALERNMDICKLDFYMLDRVCSDLRRWIDEGRHVVPISVNMSRKHMLDAELVEHIVSVIDKHQVPHALIEVELTETTTDVEFRDLKRVVNGLHREGIATSIDDFGIGYSSMRLLRDVPWSSLKIDKSFLPGDEKDMIRKNDILFKHLIAMAGDLGLECIAEGVESEEQVGILKENSCSVAQGFYYDRPLPVEDFETRLMQFDAYYAHPEEP